jgi:hypothetical protein
MPDFPGFEHIYDLSDPFSNRPLRGELDVEVDWFALTRGEIKAPRLITVSWNMGGGLPSDLV